jgi:hypothetical protein
MVREKGKGRLFLCLSLPKRKILTCSKKSLGFFWVAEKARKYIKLFPGGV